LPKKYNDPIPNPTPVDMVGCKPFRYSGLNLQRIGTFYDEETKSYLHQIKDLNSEDVKVKDSAWLKIVCEKVVSLRKRENQDKTND
jgi:hypothetical protein